jgi:hypothetical protein
MTSAPPITPLKFALRYRAGAYIVTPKRRLASQEPPLAAVDKYNFEQNDERSKMIPAEPPAWEPLEGDHATVTARANELNENQWANGYMYFFFFPEIAGSRQGYDVDHCDACRRGQDSLAA